jgi:predicted nucleotidyltransferase
MLTMRIEEVCKAYHVALCYLFGSQKEIGAALLRGKHVQVDDPESDIDFAVSFVTTPRNALEVYARLSIDLGELVSPFKTDLVFLHEVDHVLQIEAINGINIYSLNEEYREAFEQKAMAFVADELHLFGLNERDLLEAIEDGYFEFEYQADRG